MKELIMDSETGKMILDNWDTFTPFETLDTNKVRKPTMFDVIEIDAVELQKITEDGFELKLVPVTEDLRTEHIANEDRISTWSKRRKEMALSLNRQFENNLITVEDTLFIKDAVFCYGWTKFWMRYYRIVFDSPSKEFALVIIKPRITNPKNKDRNEKRRKRREELRKEYEKSVQKWDVRGVPKRNFDF